MLFLPCLNSAGHTVVHSENFEGFEVKDFYGNIKQMLTETEYYSLTLFLVRAQPHRGFYLVFNFYLPQNRS